MSTFGALLVLQIDRHFDGRSAARRVAPGVRPWPLSSPRRITQMSVSGRDIHLQIHALLPLAQRRNTARYRTKRVPVVQRDPAPGHAVPRRGASERGSGSRRDLTTCDSVSKSPRTPSLGLFGGTLYVNRRLAKHGILSPGTPTDKRNAPPRHWHRSECPTFVSLAFYGPHERGWRYRQGRRAARNSSNFAAVSGRFWRDRPASSIVRLEPIRKPSAEGEQSPTVLGSARMTVQDAAFSRLLAGGLGLPAVPRGTINPFLSFSSQAFTPGRRWRPDRPDSRRNWPGR